MNKLEKFSLFTGIFGLLADSIALTTFILGVFSFQKATTSNSSQDNILSIIFAISSGLILFYGWFIISWFAVRRYCKMRLKHPSKVGLSFDIFMTANLCTISGFGILLSPAFLMWFALVIDNKGQMWVANALFIMFGVGLIISLLIVLLMYILYEDMILLFEGIGKSV